jgi:hypothetical protein
MESTDSFDFFPLILERLKRRAEFVGDVVSQIPIYSAPIVQILCQMKVHSPSGTGFSQRFHVYHDTLVDTGAPFTVFPYQFWKDLDAAAIDRLDPHNEDAHKLLQFASVDGGSVSAFMGRVEVSLKVEFENRTYTTPRFTILAKFLDGNPMRKSPTINRQLLGMNSMEPFELFTVNHHSGRACLGSRLQVAKFLFSDPYVVSNGRT